MLVQDFDTPCAVVDLDIMENNLRRCQTYLDRHGLRLRPHIKTHKIPAFAHSQIRLGAKGVNCQKRGEAEVMADAGIADILLESRSRLVGIVIARSYGARNANAGVRLQASAPAGLGVPHCANFCRTKA